MPETDSITQRRSFRLRFSILNLLLIATIVAMGIVIWQQQRRIAGMQESLDFLGFIEVVEESRYYATPVPTYSGRTFRSRVWLPEGQRYTCFVATDNLPATGLPHVSDPTATHRDSASSIRSISDIQAGESLITVAIRQHDTKQESVVNVDIRSPGRVTGATLTGPIELQSVIAEPVSVVVRGAKSASPPTLALWHVAVGDPKGLAVWIEAVPEP